MCDTGARRKGRTMSVETGTYSKGLEGIIADETTVSMIDGQKGKLYYRGYSIEDLAAHSDFEEVVYLLLFERLPAKPELEPLEPEPPELEPLEPAPAEPTPLESTLEYDPFEPALAEALAL